MITMGNVGIALLLTILAGLSTGIGSLIAYLINKPKTIYLSFSLGLSAGVMIYVSFIELLPQALHNIGDLFGSIAFFLGILFIGDIRLGIVIAIAIAIHNIPEGISVSIPIFYATKSKKKAFIYSFLSGLAEPIGAIVGYFILLPFLSDIVLVSLFAFVAGIMIYIAIDELLPMAHQYGHSHTVISGVILGMAVMAISIILL
jgi:ZIP family zinc transporter